MADELPEEPAVWGGVHRASRGDGYPAPGPLQDEAPCGPERGEWVSGASVAGA